MTVASDHMANGASIVFGLGTGEPVHDPDMFDGDDDEMLGLFYSECAD